MPQFLFFHTIFISQKEYFPHQKSEASPGSPSATVELGILEKLGERRPSYSSIQPTVQEYR